MKSKLAIFIVATSILIGVWFVRPVFADSNHFVVYAIQDGSYFRPYLYNCASNASLVNDGDYYKLNRGAEYFIGNNLRFSTAQEAVAYALTKVNELYVTTTSDWTRISKTTPVIITNGINVTATGNNIFNSIEDYEESLIPSWWDNVKQAFMDFVGSDTMSAVISGDWLSYIDEVLFGELWTVKVGEGEDGMIIPETVSATPTPSPTPIPTTIPYSTVIDPGTGEITYHYTINVSGTPVPTSSIYPPVTSSPPGPGSGSTIDEPVAVEDYYEPDDSLSVPKLRIFKFLLRMTGNDVDVGMDSLDDNMAVMDATLEDNAEAISGVGDLFQLIPVKWFILIGTLACFPVIAAMIKSLLGG